MIDNVANTAIEKDRQENKKNGEGRVSSPESQKRQFVAHSSAVTVHIITWLPQREAKAEFPD